MTNRAKCPILNLSSFSHPCSCFCTGVYPPALRVRTLACFCQLQTASNSDPSIHIAFRPSKSASSTISGADFSVEYQVGSWTAKRYKDQVCFYGDYCHQSMALPVSILALSTDPLFVFCAAEVNVEFGAIVKQKSFFESGSGYSGILGLAYPTLARVGFAAVFVLFVLLRPSDFFHANSRSTRQSRPTLIPCWPSTCPARRSFRWCSATTSRRRRWATASWFVCKAVLQGCF